VLAFVGGARVFEGYVDEEIVAESPELKALVERLSAMSAGQELSEEQKEAGRAVILGQRKLVVAFVSFFLLFPFLVGLVCGVGTGQLIEAIVATAVAAFVIAVTSESLKAAIVGAPVCATIGALGAVLGKRLRRALFFFRTKRKAL